MNDEEFHNQYSSLNITRGRWEEHATRMRYEKYIQNFLGNSEGKKPLIRHNDDVKMDRKEMGCHDED